MKVLQKIKTNIQNGKFKENRDKVIWTNTDIGQIIEDIASLSLL